MQKMGSRLDNILTLFLFHFVFRSESCKKVHFILYSLRVPYRVDDVITFTSDELIFMYLVDVRDNELN